MKTISTAAIVALTTTMLAMATGTPAMAQDAPAATAQVAQGDKAMQGFRRGDLGFGGFLNFERGAEAIEIALVRLSHRIELTAQQQTLLETLKTDALAAANTFASTTESLRPTDEAETVERPDISERFADRLAVQQARLTALETVQPAFTAFFDSLSDEQKASLTPERGERPDGAMRGPGMHAPRGHGFGASHRG